MLKKLLREPLLHFLLIGAALFLIYYLQHDGTPDDDSNRIVITEAHSDRVIARWEKQRQRLPTPEELDGLVPLGYLLRDDRLIEKARRWIDYIVTHQQDDGWLGLVKYASYGEHDPWPTFVVLKAMAQYFEVTETEGTSRIEERGAP